MKNRTLIILITTGILTLIIFTANSMRSNTNSTPRSNVLASSHNLEGFKRALPPANIKFPQDFGPHEDFQTEWWYYTGNLKSNEGHQFGYQFTIFRRALLPSNFRIVRETAWATDQVYLAHFAITDVSNNQHSAFEKFSRGAADLAGAQAVPYQVWLDDWYVKEIGNSSYEIYAMQDQYTINLKLVDVKGPVLQGINGYSQKSDEPGNASYYYSQTRLQTSGTLIANSIAYTVEGYSWKDHEYSTSALSKDQIGWDWFAIQLTDATELKVFKLRRSDGTIDRFSSGSYIDDQGNIHSISISDFEIIAQSTWKSPHSDAEYPSGWNIRVPKFGIDLMIKPLIKDQELNVSYSYWEGAVEVNGMKNGMKISGYGYAELTGYTQSMAGEF